MTGFPGVHTICGLSNISYGFPTAQAYQPELCGDGYHQGFREPDYQSTGQTDDGQYDPLRKRLRAG